MQKVLLKNVADIAISNVDKKSKDSEIPVTLCNFTDVYYNWSITKTQCSKFMRATATVNEIEKFKIINGDVAITKDSETRDDIGVSTFFDDVADDVLLGYHCALIRPNKSYLDGAYLNALLNTSYAKRYFAYNASGSGQRFSLSIDSISNFPFELPSLSVQLRITNILGTIDRKIQLNEYKIKKLDLLVQDIFDFWFVQYDFPNAQGKPYKSSGGKLVWCNELNRAIPCDWKYSNLYEIADFINGLACQKHRPKCCELGLPVIKIKEMHDGITEHTERATVNVPKDYIIHSGDILFSWSATLEVMYWFNIKGVLNQHIFKVVPKEWYLQDYAYRQISQYIRIFKKIAESRKTTMGHITTDHLAQSKIVIPSTSVLIEYSKRVSPLLHQIRIINYQLQKLKNIKQNVLPLLMNGQVVVQ